MSRHAPDAGLEWTLGLLNEIDRTERERGPRTFAVTFAVGGAAAAYLGGLDAWWFTGLAWIATAWCVRLEVLRRRRLAWLRERRAPGGLTGGRP